MTLDRTRLNWGVFLIVLGAVPLAYNRGVISTDTVTEMWRLWPLILIGIGLGIVLARTPAAFIGGLAVAACVGLVLGSLLAVGPHVGCGSANGPTHSYTRDGAFDVTDARVVLELQCGSATVTTSSDNGWHIDGSVRGDDPVVTATGNQLAIRQGDQSGWFVNRRYQDWAVTLPSGLGELSAELDAGDASYVLAGASISRASFSVNAGSLKVDLSSARVDDLALSTNVGSASLILDGGSNTTGRVSNNVGSTDICAPAGLGLSIRYSSSLASENFSAAGLSLVNGTWQTSGYDTASFRAVLTIDNSVGSVTLNPAGGCK
jgi:hypothetical protein